MPSVSPTPAAAAAKTTNTPSGLLFVPYPIPSHAISSRPAPITLHLVTFHSHHTPSHSCGQDTYLCVRRNAYFRPILCSRACKNDVSYVRKKFSTSCQNFLIFPRATTTPPPPPPSAAAGTEKNRLRGGNSKSFIFLTKGCPASAALAARY